MLSSGASTVVTPMVKKILTVFVNDYTIQHSVRNAVLVFHTHGSVDQEGLVRAC